MRYHVQVGFIPEIQDWLNIINSTDVPFSCQPWYFPLLPRNVRQACGACRRASTTAGGLVPKDSLSPWVQKSPPSPKDTKSTIGRSCCVPPSPGDTWWLCLGKPLLPPRYHQRHQINRADQNNITIALKIKLLLKPGK